MPGESEPSRQHLSLSAEGTAEQLAEVVKALGGLGLTGLTYNIQVSSSAEATALEGEPDPLAGVLIDKEALHVYAESIGSEHSVSGRAWRRLQLAGRQGKTDDRPLEFLPQYPDGVKSNDPFESLDLGSLAKLISRVDAITLDYRGNELRALYRVFGSQFGSGLLSFLRGFVESEREKRTKRDEG